MGIQVINIEQILCDVPLSIFPVILSTLFLSSLVSPKDEENVAFYEG